MRTPVTLIIFNRPDLTERVFTEIARARPEKLLVIADGPRPGHEGDAEKCAAARDVIERVDWECEVLKNYSDVNLGCAHRPASGLQWVFQQVEEAIILEDDCVPHPTFFRYCDDLLELYRDDERVMHISGNNFLPGYQENSSSYSFSAYCLSWGWATWRRAFRHYDPRIQLWPTLRDQPWLLDILRDTTAVDHWTRIYDLTYASVDNVNTWDFQWLFACWAQRGLSILPNSNLVSNIGFGDDATHTRRAGDKRANHQASAIRFPLKHPSFIMRDLDADQRIFEEVVLPHKNQPSTYDKLRQNCIAALPTAVKKRLLSMRDSLSRNKRKET